MKKKLLLINPWIYDFTAYDLWSKPLGLLYIAAFLREYGFTTHFIDCLSRSPEVNKKVLKTKKYGVGNYQKEIAEVPPVLSHIPRKYSRYGISEDALIEQLIHYKDSDAVLLTSIMTYWYPGLQRVTELVREYLPGVPVVLGGIYATLLPEHAKAAIKPDYLIQGPGEIEVLKLLTRIFDLSLDQSTLPKTLDEYPYPAFDLIEPLDYLVIMTSRGCPYNCSFCAQKRIAMAYSRRTPQNVVDEFKTQYARFKIRDFAFYDDALFINQETHIVPILEKLIDLKLPLRLHAPNGLFAKYVDKKLAQLMFKANFKTIRLSFETSSETRRKDMYSKVSNEDMIRSVSYLVEAGYKPSVLEAYVLMGLAGQEVEEVLASIIFIHNLGVKVKLASFSPIPGTREFERAVKQGYLLEDIDPLLTNKTIFPLYQKEEEYRLFRKIRTFAQVLNEAAQKGLILFGNDQLGNALLSVLKGMA